MTPDDRTDSVPPADSTRDQADAALDAGLAAAFAPDDTRARPAPAEPEAGTVVGGRYRLTERIGEGGMGSVWAATQTEPVKRKVAVKLIKAGMDSKAVLARFDAERQALAVMDHPNIAKVLDGGVHDGRPYFVMELVKGVPITRFCDERKLTPQQRLELFVPVCQAIQHAHMKGVIHRDIKPSNVLVALYDDRPVPKVIDFGVAKATGAALTEHTLETGFGAVVGTPAYMSPEQASLNNLDIDTRSDVYALGILLYELLTGSPPFTRKDLEKKGLLEMLRVVREEEPPRPSVKLSTADALPSLSANRGTEPKKLTGLLRNELDWIVMKALEKDRSRRYDTANGFAADVLRFLSGEPVQAHPPSAAYRVNKFVRRNKGRVAAVGLVLLALVVGLAGTLWQWGVAARERHRSEQVADAARADRSAEQWARRRMREAFRGLTDEALGRFVNLDIEEWEIEEDRRLKARVLREVANFPADYLKHAGDSPTDRAIRAEGHLWQGLDAFVRADPAARRSFSASLAEYDRLCEEQPDVPDYHIDRGECLLLLASLADQDDDAVERDRLKAEAVDGVARLAAVYPDQAEYRYHWARLLEQRALVGAPTSIHRPRDDLNRADELLTRLVAERPDDPRCRLAAASVARKLGDDDRAEGRPERAVEHYTRALRLLGRADGPDRHPDFTLLARLTRRNRANTLSGEFRRHAEAAADWEWVVGSYPEPKDVWRIDRAQYAYELVRAGQLERSRSEAELAGGSNDPVVVMMAAEVFAQAVAAPGVPPPDRERDAVRAVDLLRRTTGLFNEPKDFAARRNLDPIRERDDFKKLMAELEAKARSAGPKR